MALTIKSAENVRVPADLRKREIVWIHRVRQVADIV